jgi:hypothetical protein
LSTAIEIIKWVKKIAGAQAKVTHILRPGKASEKTPKGVIPPSLCEISQNASRKKKRTVLKKRFESSKYANWMLICGGRVGVGQHINFAIEMFLQL